MLLAAGSQTAAGVPPSGNFQPLHPPRGIKARPLLLQRGDATAAGGPDVPVPSAKETHAAHAARLPPPLPARDASRPRVCP